MATPIHIARPIIYQPSENTSATSRSKYGPPIVTLNNRRPLSASFAVASSESSSTEAEKPQIELDFIGPKAGNDGSYPMDRVKAVSGEKLLRNIMLDNKIELYATYGKVMNCGGGGSCGTCIVEIIDGKDLLNERTNTELKYLKKVQFLISPIYKTHSQFRKPRSETERDGTDGRRRISRLLHSSFTAVGLTGGGKLRGTKKPESWRLACQTIVGNKENSGKVVVQRIPQWKK